MQKKSTDAVSPVIAVILILMLTVLLVGIIGALVMGMSSDTVSGINTSFLQQKNEWDLIKIVYNGNGNTGGTVPVDEGGPYEPGETIVVADGSTLFRDEYVFTLWTTNADGSGDPYSEGANLILNAYTVLYAQWELEPDWYSVDYVNNGDSNVTISTSHDCAKKGSLVTLIGADTKNSDLVFTGWNTNSDGTGVSYKKGDTYDGKDGTLILHAQWENVDSGET